MKKNPSSMLGWDRRETPKENKSTDKRKKHETPDDKCEAILVKFL